MNNKQRRKAAAEQRQWWKAKKLTKEFQELDISNTPFPPQERPSRALANCSFLVQIYDESRQHPHMMRLSVCRTTRTAGGWADKITWDELDAIKTDLGYGEWYGVEVYPRNQDKVNVANFRHLWLFPIPLNIGWFASGK